ncbi:MAG: FAD-binding oxidoreductase [Pseudomonadota bacterium]
MDTINKTIEALLNNLGSRKVITDTDILEKYSRDETPDLEFYPDVLVRAESAQDVSLTLKICNNDNIPVTPRGAGTGVTGGSVPVCGGVVLSLEKLNHILEIDQENMVAVVEPGVITGDIQKAVGEYGLMYPPDPASLESCSIGGNVAENAGGPRAVKYGTTKDYILGLEFVLPDGCIITTGGKTVKYATGYNLSGIILGSEGTLAVITKIHLRLISLPRVVKDVLVPFASLDEALDAVHAILHNRIIPAALEFMEEAAIRLVAKHLDNKIPFPDAQAYLFIQLDGSTEESVFNDVQIIAGLLHIDHEKIFIAESSHHRERLWKARRSIREALQAESPIFFAEDCVVPRSKIPEFLKKLKLYFNEKKQRSIMFGHAGDGNVHIDILKGDTGYAQWKSMLPEMKKEIYRQAIMLGGTITGEHGIGYLRKEYLPMALNKDEIELSKRLKAAFDPNNILNPGKIF